ncbi:type II toxin-antitoxin system death-on-curing family toxin [Desulforamulus aeronauticus]|uniref:Death on curing protein n=1 Tax=Desulforamulus aeronauticus DSM 10349 TaxID=1121421 RepID=A0A1M6NY55_9FIRM|nr:type II toxin-antitoxin system death-on-curing family toxin [Desulforamulus aeronauticus]SHK00655.1 death on curing protein [Desulforamulus aeronauticus DSM 10349]
MKWLSIDYILKLHGKMSQRTGGATGLRDISLLQSAIYNAQATFDGQDLYPDIESKIAAVCYGVINNHPFVDGNKRLGIYLMLILLDYNDYPIEFHEDELVDLGFAIAEGIISKEYISRWIQEHAILPT